MDLLSHSVVPDEAKAKSVSKRSLIWVIDFTDLRPSTLSPIAEVMVKLSRLKKD